MIKRDPDCTLCKLHKTADFVCLLGDGPERAEVMIIGEAPGATEDSRGRPFVGRSGQLLRTALSEAGIEPDEVFITNAVSCRPPDNRAPTKAEIKACKAWLDYQIKKVKPSFVLLLGNTPLISVTGKPGIRARRGKPFEKDGVIYMPTFHPAFILRDPTQEALFENDLRAFASIIEHGEVPREDNLRPHLVLTMTQVDEMLEALEGIVSFDIETTCLYPWQTHELKKSKGQLVRVPHPAKVNIIGFGTSKGEFTLPLAIGPFSDDVIDDILHRIDRRLRSRKVKLVTHNGKFDFLWMLVKFALRWHDLMHFDTMLAHYVLDENDRHGLKYLAQKFLGAPDWDIDKDEKRGAATLEKQAMYHAHDLYYTRELAMLFEDELAKDDRLQLVFDEILMPCARMFVEVEYDGVVVNVDKFEDAERHLRNQYAQALAGLKKWEPKDVVDARGRPVDFNWGSTKQLAELLFDRLKLPVIERTKTGAPSCNESVIKRIDHECVGDLLKFREAKQQLSFFIDGWKPYLDKRYRGGEWVWFLHPSFKLHGTVTGRLSCENPNLQQVPRDERIRSLITAERGWTLVECDLSQIELRIAAELAGERKMLWAFANGVDVHWLTAISEISRGGGMKEIVLDTARTWKQDKSLNYARSIEVLLEMGPDAASEINSAWKELRKKAKAINFGYLYGMWWKKFKIYARDNYGVNVTDEQAQQSREAFFSEYADYPEWHRRQRMFARRNGYVRSLSGRKRRLPAALLAEDTPERREAERQAINSPVQSFANELNLMAAIQLRKEFGRDVVRICGTVHDAILVRVRDDHVAKVTRRLLKIMQHPDLLDVFDIKLRVPVLAEAKVGPWGAGIDFHKWEKKHGRRV